MKMMLLSTVNLTDISMPVTIARGGWQYAATAASAGRVPYQADGMVSLSASSRLAGSLRPTLAQKAAVAWSFSFMVWMWVVLMCSEKMMEETWKENVYSASDW
jgi:hypothetical protein